ncbi:hypothetical protein [Deinococcus humi]|uniref:Lipoprotein n=1 Tax=Deinococcus humi TaxID=662880 RepID=A0A7W8NHI0_9DEIO|nr:hypothetical protein [Deinococcus humi]MBB5364037.1 hypothetical protein [Deinococcus humi]GGO32585.1 hypothetical protein GCM10008949_30330 [Deinococcus humi]
MFLLPLLLAACAPAVQTNPITTASRTYAASCPAVLDALTAVAIRTQPSGAVGVGSWSLLGLVSRTESTATYSSQSMNQFATTVQATCTGEATLTLDSAGQTPPLLNALNSTLLDGVKLP